MPLPALRSHTPGRRPRTPGPRLKPGPVFVASGGVINYESRVLTHAPGTSKRRTGCIYHYHCHYHRALHAERKGEVAVIQRQIQRYATTGVTMTPVIVDLAFSFEGLGFRLCGE